MIPFKPFDVKLLNDYHPEGYEDEWLDKGDVVQAEFMPSGRLYLSSGGLVFNSNATIEDVELV